MNRGNAIGNANDGTLIGNLSLRGQSFDFLFENFANFCWIKLHNLVLLTASKHTMDLFNRIFYRQINHFIANMHNNATNKLGVDAAFDF